MRLKHWSISIVALIISFTMFLPITWAQSGEPESSIEVTHRIIGLLGDEHIANAVYRTGSEGPRIVAWGDRILEWPVGSAAMTEVVPGKLGFGYTNGGCTMDVNQDGVEDVVVGRGEGRNQEDAELLWFSESGESDVWAEHLAARLNTPPWDAPHDIYPFIQENRRGQALRGVLLNIDRKELYLYLIPANPGNQWEGHDIGMFPAEYSQSGMALDDINGDGRQDLVSGMFWVESPNDPREVWSFHRFGTWDANQWGGMTKHALADFDDDGDLEIAAAEAEIPDARFAIFDRTTSDGTGKWQEHRITSDLYCPHSLVAGDFNQDGRPDLAVGEMTAGGWNFPLNPNPKVYLYINQGNMEFTRTVISEGWGVHEMDIAPLEAGEGIILFGADEIQNQKFTGMRTNVSLWYIGQ